MVVDAFSSGANYRAASAMALAVQLLRLDRV
jgi:hypothetical protein